MGDGRFFKTEKEVTTVLKAELITLENVKEAKDVLNRIFTDLPREIDPYTPVLMGEYEAVINADYYEVFDEDEVVATFGHYSVPENPDSAWLGWFGTLPEKRRFHYGSRVLTLMEDTARSKGYKFVRLYTETENAPARKFYESLGYVAENYNSPQEPSYLEGLFVTYSKSLGDWPLEPWNSGYLAIAETLAALYPPEMVKEFEEQFASKRKQKQE